MKNSLKSLTLLLAAVMGLAVSTLSTQAQTATATIFGVQNGANWDYTITLVNTSSTLSLNGFWYGWIQFENDLPTSPTAAGNSLGWANGLDGTSIQYQNSTGTALGPNQSATFTFVDASSPTAITAGISGESVAYTGIIDASQSSPGDSTGIFSPVLIVPEPSTWGLLGVGLMTVAGFKLRRTTVRR